MMNEASSRPGPALIEDDADEGSSAYDGESLIDGDSLSEASPSSLPRKTTPITPMPRLVRPVPRATGAPVRVVRPIPQRASDRFYQAAHASNIPLSETHNAVVVARDWHRKWTQQDEEGHASTRADFYDQPTQRHDQAPEEELFFRRGAKNPSLGEIQSHEELSSQASYGFESPSPSTSGGSGSGSGSGKRSHGRLSSVRMPPSRDMNLSPVESEVGDDDEGGGVHLDQLLVLNPEDRLSSSLSSNTAGSSAASSQPILAPRVKRQFVGFATPTAPASVGDEDGSSCSEDDEDDERGMLEPVLRPVRPLLHPVAIRPLAVRPVAMRIVRPVPVQPVAYHHPQHRSGVPEHVFGALAANEHDISPVSFVGGSSFVDDEDDSSIYHPPMIRPSPSVGPQTPATNVETVNVIEDDVEETQPPSGSTLPPEIATARQSLLHSLAVTQGDVDSDLFKQCLRNLIEKSYKSLDIDTRAYNASSGDLRNVEGMWLTLSKPNYFASLGENDNGDPMYTLGRMSFDMFSPTNLICSLQGNFNPVEVVCDDERRAMLEKVPKKLREEVESGKTILRTYHVVAAFTIEPNLAAFPDAPNKDVHRPIRGIMTTFGYSLPDPNVVNRHSIWFTGGRIEPNDDPKDVSAWKRLFIKHPPKHTFGEKAKLLAVKLLMGATVPNAMATDGSMEYAFNRPLGGHGMAYVDVVYIDSMIRIVRGQRGTIFVFSRLEGKGAKDKPGEIEASSAQISRQSS